MITKRRLALGAALAIGLGLAATPLPALADSPKGGPAKGAKDKGKEATPATPAQAPTATKPITIQPKELAWGIDRKKLEAIYDKVIDDDFKERYRKVQPGPNMEALDAEVAERKNEFRRSYTEFGKVATGFDSTPLRPEYSYNNGEALMQVDRGGKVRYFFFIGGKLYKVIDVVKLGEKSAWGKTFVDAVAKLAKYYGVEGRIREADAAQNRPFVEVDWRDSTSEIRAIDWGGDQVAMAFQDAVVVANLPNLRKNKESAAGNVDAGVKDVQREKPPAPPPPKPDNKPVVKGKQ